MNALLETGQGARLCHNRVLAAKDIYQQHVRQALEQDGWTITHDPLSLPELATTLKVEPGAERVIGAQKGTEKIAVEVKSFIGASARADLENALGQFVLYRTALKTPEPDRRLSWALREDVYESLFEQLEGEILLTEVGLRLLVFNDNREEVVPWIS